MGYGYDAAGAGLGIFLILIYLAIMGISIYSFVLYIKLANRGIKALDIYLNKNSRPNYPPASYYGGHNPVNPNPQSNRDDNNKQ